MMILEIIIAITAIFYLINAGSIFLKQIAKQL